MSLTVASLVLTSPAAYPASADESFGHVVAFEGRLFDETTADALIARDNLISLARYGKFVPVLYSGDANVDGYYDQIAVNGDTLKVINGMIRSRFAARRLGGADSVRFQSRWYGKVRTNAHGYLQTDAKPIIVPPVGAFAVDADGAATPTRGVRTLAAGAGTLNYYLNVPEGTHLYWRCAPVNYMRGAVRLRVAGVEREGRDVPNSPGDWELENGLIRVTSHTSLQHLKFFTWDEGIGAWILCHTSNSGWLVQHPTGTNQGVYTGLEVLRSDPECRTIKLVTSIGDDPLYCYVSLRRGSRYVELRWVSPVSATFRWRPAGTGEAAANIASGAGLATVARFDDDRLLAATPHAVTRDTANMYLTTDNARTDMHVMMGIEKNVPGGGGEGAEDLWVQYLANQYEEVHAVVGRR